MYIPRKIQNSIHNYLDKNKIVVLYGARQTGKTTLVNQILNDVDEKVLRINADQKIYVDLLSSRDLMQIKGLVDGYDVLFIDEAQRIPEIGINLKIIHDEIPGLKVIVTGSSSLHLAGKIQEPLTGRKRVFHLFPFTLQELEIKHNRFELERQLENFMIYGQYPEVMTTTNINEKENLLYEIGNSYLFKDVTDLQNLKHENKLRELLMLLAFQIGSEVSINELSKKLSISRDAVTNYIHLLEHAFIIFRLSGFSRNLRKEVTKMDKFYFYDNGIRNMIIENYKPINKRNDVGQLWENFIISERYKYLKNNNIHCNSYFWRTYTGSELDYLEENAGELNGWEFKFNKKTFKVPQAFLANYENAKASLVNKHNLWNFVSDPQNSR